MKLWEVHYYFQDIYSMLQCCSALLTFARVHTLKNPLKEARNYYDP